MGKVIKKKNQGMSLRTKFSLVTTLTLLVSVFMYQGWYKPNHVQAATVTYNVQSNTGTTVATGVTTNCPAVGTNPTVATRTLMTTAALNATSQSVRPTAAGAREILKVYFNTGYGTSTTVSPTSFKIRLRDSGTGGWTAGVQVFSIASNGTETYIGTEVTSAVASAGDATPTLALNGSVVVPAGSKLGVRVRATAGTSTGMRAYWGATADTAGTGTSGVLIVNETAASPPTITSVSPNTRVRGSAAATVTITGTSLTGGAVSFSNAGVSGGAATVTSTTITLPVTVTAGATTGTGTVTVTTPGGSANSAFTVTAAASPPTITSVSPNTRVRGSAAATVTITGTNLTGGAVSFSNAGVSGGAATVASTTITLPVTVTAGATTGTGTVTVTTPGGSANSAFTVTAAASPPTITSVSPNTRVRGSAAATVTITGTNLTGGAVSFSNAGVSGGAATVTSTTITLPVTVTAGATTGAGTVTVTTPGGSANSAFTVTAAASPPTITSVSPNTRVQGSAAATVTITGTNLTGGAASFSNAGVSGGAATVTATTITLPVTVTAGATTGAGTVTVTTPGGSANSAFTVTASGVNSTTATALTFSAVGSSQITVTAPFTGDSNANNTCIIRWGTASGTYPNTATSSKSGNSYAATVSGLSASTTSFFQATFTDIDGITGSPVTGSRATTAITNPLMHSSASLNSTKYGTWGATYTCETCHNKNTTNIKRIAQQVNTPTGLRTVTFSRMTANTTNNDATGVFGNDNRTYAINASTNICEVCHHQTSYHQYSSSKITSGNRNHFSANNTDCTGCHFHNAGFKGSGGHTTPYPGITHMAGLAPGTYDSCTGCHTAPSGPYPAVSGAPACTSCHLNAANFNSASAGCADCHGTNANGGRPTGTTFPDIAGSHSAAGHGSLACSICHNNAGTGTANHGSQNRTAKTRADVTVAFSGAGTWNGSAALTCSATYCHSTVQNVTGTAAGVADTTPAWGSGTANCTTNCHGNTGARLTTGSHVKHLAATHGTYTCDNCHTGSGQSTPALHANSIINVQQNALLGSAGTYTQAAAAPGNGGFGTCAASYCHSTVQSATGGTGPTYRAPAWGGAVLTCAGCHGSTAATLTTGSHSAHLNAAYACSDCHGTAGGAGNTAIHANQSINVDLTNRGSGTYAGDAIPQNSNFGTCANTTCHGTNSATWGVANANATCAKCHGVVGTTPAAYTADTKTAAPGYNGTGVNTAGTVGTISGGVSNNAKAGAHDTHLKGTLGYKTGGVSCTDCHAVNATGDAGHMNGSTTMAWSPLVTNSGALTPGYTAPTCTVNYCHGASFAVAVRGTGLAPSWIDGAYLANAASVKNALDCNKCHTSPPAASTAFDHSAAAMPAGLATDCASCHPHNGSGPQHIDGTLQGGGGCNACHDYDTVGATYAAGKWTGGAWGKSSKDGLTPNQGFGAHAKHINYIKTRLNITVALVPTPQTYGAGEPANVCGSCHTNLVANHTTSGSTARTINFGDNTFRIGGSAGTSFLFGATNPAYSGVSGTSSATTAKTCSNLSCHYFTTPVWSTY